MAVLNPLKVVIENYPDDLVEELEAINNPEDEAAGTRRVPFSKVLYIERDDFMEDPPRKFLPFGAGPGSTAALCLFHHLYRCYQRRRRGGGGTALYLRSGHARRRGARRQARESDLALGIRRSTPYEAEARLYDSLFTVEEPGSRQPKGFHRVHQSGFLARSVDPIFVEPSVRQPKAGDRFQFERLAYFVVDPDSTADKLVFNRTVALRDQWSKARKKGGGQARKKKGRKR